MEQRSTNKNGIINLLTLLLVGIGSYVAARVSGSLSGILSSVFIGLGALVAAVSWFQMRLEETERLEKLEFEELAESKGGSALFEAQGCRGLSGAAIARTVRAVLRAGFTVLLFLAAGRRGLVSLALAFQSPTALADVKRTDHWIWRCLVCSCCCCSCSDAFRPR